MTDIYWQTVNGIVERGHRVASGLASDSPFPHGTIEMQIPRFKELGLDLTGFFKGTLNVSISPKTLNVVNPEFTFKNVEWTDKHQPENFSFSRCRIVFKDLIHDCWIYYPDPKTKERDFQKPYIIEIIAPHISEIEYGSSVLLKYNPSEIIIN